MRKLIVYTDGASKGNPGDAGIGVVISTEEGTVLREIAEYIGNTTNNVAEYKALIRGLQECLELGASVVEISTDSELLARQIAGVYKVKSELLKPLYAEALSILRRFEKVSISHVLREFNKRADELANEGVRRKNQPPRRPTEPSKAKLPDRGPFVQKELEF
jgi:ribonuclease HI